MRAMTVQNQVFIRPLEAPDVSPILEIIRECRREYGLEGRVRSLLETSDCAIFDRVARGTAITIAG